MRKRAVRLIVGIGVVVTHLVSFFAIVFVQRDYIPPADRLDVALLLVPITAAYVTAIVRSAISEQANFDPGPELNANYIAVCALITAAFCIGLLSFVFYYPEIGGPTTTDLKRWLVVIEIGFGTAFGLLAEDLFGKVEKVGVEQSGARS